MKIGLFLALFSDVPLEEALDAAVAAGCGAVEIASTAVSAHCRPAELLEDAGRARALRREGRRARARRSPRSRATGTRFTPSRGREPGDRDFRDTVRLAAELGVGP